MVLFARVFLPFAIAYSVTYLLRVVNAVAGEPISADLGLTAADLGFLTSVFFVGFALSQVPLGVLMDRFGARRVHALVLLLAAVGCAVFALADAFWQLIIGRVLIGVGASMGLMAPFTAYRRWFSAERLPLVIALQMTFGAIGSSLGGLPTEATLVALGWHGVFVVLAVMVVIVAAGIYLIVPRKNEPTGGETFGAMIADVGTILASRALWRIAPLSATSQAGFLAVLSLWAGPWLRQVAGYSSAEAGTWLSIIAAGLAIGFLGYGFIMSRAERGGHALTVFVAGAALYTMVSLAIILLPPRTATPLWLVYTALGAVGVYSYAIASRSFAADLAGRVNTTLNFLVFFFAFLTQWAFGVVLSYFPDGAGGATRLGYQVALGGLTAITLASFVPLIVLRPRTPSRQALAAEGQTSL